MNIYETDWRLSTNHLILSALIAGLRDVKDQLEIAERESDEWFGIEDALEEAEGLYGMAFIACQNYVAGTVSDVNRIFGPKKEFSKWQLIQKRNDYLPKLKITKLELCDAMANYYKHHEEWSNWESTLDRRSERTIRALRLANIGEKDDYRCHKAYKLIVPDDKDLTTLLEVLRDWRKATFDDLKRGYYS